MSAADPYLYPGTDVLRNRHNIRDQDLLADREQLESRRALLDLRRAPVTGAFDLSHYRNTHRRLFERVYEWAGESRTIDLWKAEIVFRGRSVAYSPPASIEADATYALGQMRERLTTDLTDTLEAVRFSSAVAELWRSHPFREGNTRTLLAFVEQYTRHRDVPLDQTIINRVPSQMRDALALATTGDVSELSDLFQAARRFEQQRNHRQLGLLTSEAAEIIRLLGHPRIVQPEIGSNIRGQVLTTSYRHVLVRDSRQVIAVPLRSFTERPENNQRVAVRVLGPGDRPSRQDIAELEHKDRRELAATVLIPAALTPLGFNANQQERRAAAIAIPAPSQALADALATRPPQDIAQDSVLAAEARTIQDALYQRFGRPGAALLTNGAPDTALKLLPPGQDLESVRNVLQPLRATILAQQDLAMAQERKHSLSQEGPSLGPSR